jgi:Ulp1 family protease
MMLDPLNISRQVAANDIKSYLKQEAMTKLQIDEADFIEPEIVMSSCPTQNNYTDCGVYCLHYIHSFFKHTDAMMKTLHVSYIYIYMGQYTY